MNVSYVEKNKAVGERDMRYKNTYKQYFQMPLLKDCSFAMQLSGHSKGHLHYCWLGLLHVLFLSKDYNSLEHTQIYIFVLVKTINFQEHSCLNLFADKAITEYAKSVQQT